MDLLQVFTAALFTAPCAVDSVRPAGRASLFTAASLATYLCFLRPPGLPRCVSRPFAGKL